jgi:hypothetical protein
MHYIAPPLNSLRTVIIVIDYCFVFDATAHSCGAHAFRQGGLCNRGPRAQQLVRGRETDTLLT